MVQLTRRCEEVVRKNRIEKWAPNDFDFKEFIEELTSLQRIALCRGGLKRGGNPTCAIRICTKEKNVSSCSQWVLLTSSKALSVCR